MRLVVDTSVLVSYLLADESPLVRAVDAILLSHRLLHSADTIAQLAEVLHRPKIVRFVGPARADAPLWYLRSLGELVGVEEHVVACRDPRDDKFLSLALAGRADCLISGDQDLLALDPFRSIPILTVAAFAARFGAP